MRPVLVHHPKGARVVEYPTTGADPQLTPDEEVMLWQAQRIAELEYRLYIAQRMSEFWPTIPHVTCEG